MVGKVEAPAKANMIDPKAKNKMISKSYRINTYKSIFTKMIMKEG